MPSCLIRGQIAGKITPDTPQAAHPRGSSDAPVPDSPEYRAPNRLREMAAAERPQERLARHGPGALSDTELLALLLRSGTRGQDVMTVSTRLLAAAGSLAGLMAWRETVYRIL